MSTAAIVSRVDLDASQPVTSGNARTIVVNTHHEHGTWWADSPTIPGLYATANTRNDLIHEMIDVLQFAADDLDDPALAQAIRTGQFAVAITDAGTTNHLTLGA